MTRINLVDPKVLTNQHLMAEYRELPRIFTAVKKLQDDGKFPCDVEIPESYVLGAGHMKFFYNKLHWLYLRYVDLYHELINRNFSLDINIYESVCKGVIPIYPSWWKDYSPTPEDIYLNMARLAKRSKIDKVIEEINA